MALLLTEVILQVPVVSISRLGTLKFQMPIYPPVFIVTPSRVSLPLGSYLMVPAVKPCGL